MEPVEEHGYALEFQLRRLDPDLHKRFTDSVFGLQNILNNYKLLFPDFTDHTVLHSLTVLDFCNRLIGDQLGGMNKDDIYVLLMGCYLHDTGMGISEKDFELFSKQIEFGDYFERKPNAPKRTVIRDFHNEFSGLFIRKYADYFEIPSEAHLFAVVQASRGHRKTNLLDETVYSTALKTPDGSTICLPYLAALVRLADELDVTAARNSPLLYDISTITDERSMIEFKKHVAIHDLIIDPEEFILLIDDTDPDSVRHIQDMVVKMQQTLDDCRAAVNGRTPYRITQERIRIHPDKR